MLRVCDSLAGVGLWYERVVVGILRVPALAGESSRHHVHCPPVALASALVALGSLHHIAFRRCFCTKSKYIFSLVRKT